MAKKHSGIFRLTLSDESSHKRISVWHFSRLGGIVAIITAAVVLFGIFYALFALTPLRNTIPGYPDAHFKQGAIENALKVDSLENEMLRWTLYAENLSRVLSGEESLAVTDSLFSGGTDKFLENLSEKEMKRRDSLLRTTVAKEERAAAASAGKRDLPLEGVHFFAPLKGALYQGFDRTLHPAVDIAAPAGSVVSAVLDGTVLAAGWTDEEGYTVIIQHQNNIISAYKHNRQLLRKQGDKITAGTPIAVVGSGSAAKIDRGEYLHFELWYDGEPVDPAKYIKF